MMRCALCERATRDAVLDSLSEILSWETFVSLTLPRLVTRHSTTRRACRPRSRCDRATPPANASPDHQPGAVRKSSPLNRTRHKPSRLHRDRWSRDAMRRGCNVGVLEVEAFVQNSGGKKIPFEGEENSKTVWPARYFCLWPQVGCRLCALDVGHFQSRCSVRQQHICSF